MHEIGLYHPHIHFPSDAWVKTAALYWPKMARLVPDYYTTQDSDVVLALRDELDFVLNIVPARSNLDLDHTPTPTIDEFVDFVDFVDHYHRALHRRYGVDSPTDNLNDVPDDDFRLIHDDSVGSRFADILAQYNLAVRREFWHVMHPVLARVYMSALADDVARRNHLCPVTEDDDMYAVGPGWTKERLANVLLPDITGSPLVSSNPGDSSTIGMLAIQVVIPRDIDQIPVGKIIELRRQFKPQFAAFRDAVDSSASEIREQLRTVEDPAVLRAYISQEVQERFVVPLEQLRRELHRIRVDTTTATLTFKYEVPAVAAVAAGGMISQHPLLGGGAALAIGLMALKRGMWAKAADERDKHYVSYLMMIQDRLDARSTLQQIARRIRRNGRPS